LQAGNKCCGETTMASDLTWSQKTLVSYIHGSAGACYQLSDYGKRCIVGMLQTGEVTRDDFKYVHDGDTWLNEIESFATANGLEIPASGVADRPAETGNSVHQGRQENTR
jgi:hypothetical protein